MEPSIGQVIVIGGRFAKIKHYSGAVGKLATVLKKEVCYFVEVRTLKGGDIWFIQPEDCLPAGSNKDYVELLKKEC